jgi:hypothetical protein
MHTNAIEGDRHQIVGVRENQAVNKTPSGTFGCDFYWSGVWSPDDD